MYILLKKVTKENILNAKVGERLEDQIKFKPLTKSQIIISMDRLTRFKFPEDKYLRVFNDIIISNLITPKFKKSQLESMDYELLKQFATEIFNYSLNFHKIEASGDFSINSLLSKYENSIFKLSKEVQVLLDNKIDFAAAINLLDEEELPLNLKWLKTLGTVHNQLLNRKESALKFPIEKVIITEGITEEILLPKFAKLCGCDFDESGINLISAGGKNQVVKLFYQFAETLKLPIFVLLDNDAKENFAEISPKLRKSDKVHVLDNGEFEDLLPLNLIKRTLNNYLKNFSSVSLDELRKDIPMTQVLEDIFKQKGFGEFKKAEFASMIAENISSPDDVSSEIVSVIHEIKSI